MDHFQAEQTATVPVLIQGGMGVAVSDWRLARAVSRRGHLGVVSGTALDTVLVRRLQRGDTDGSLRRAIAEFPFPEMADRILERYFVPGGLGDDDSYAATMAMSQQPTIEQTELVVLANFVEVFLAKDGHEGLVGINFLEKIQSPTLPSIYGAMLAGVDYVLMGAGIPKAIPGILDRLSDGLEVRMPLHVIDATADDVDDVSFSPAEFSSGEVPWLKRPKFLAIVASATLATMLAKKASGHVDGFVIEGPTAGGHNAPPRGKTRLNSRGEPIYTDRDEVDLKAFRAIGRPFWLAGQYGSPEQLQHALRSGAAGVQVGTAFAFCQESGIDQDLKDEVIRRAKLGKLDVITDPLASPTGFPFKVLNLPGSASESMEVTQRQRRCDLGFLRQAYRRPDGSIGWRCSAESVAAFVRKGGNEGETIGRKCVCNGLMATIGLGQRRSGGARELPLVTSGNDVYQIVKFLPDADATGYHADDVIDRLLVSLPPSFHCLSRLRDSGPDRPGAPIAL